MAFCARTITQACHDENRIRNRSCQSQSSGNDKRDPQLQFSPFLWKLILIFVSAFSLLPSRGSAPARSPLVNGCRLPNTTFVIQSITPVRANPGKSGLKLFSCSRRRKEAQTHSLNWSTSRGCKSAPMAKAPIPPTSGHTLGRPSPFTHHASRLNRPSRQTMSNHVDLGFRPSDFFRSSAFGFRISIIFNS